METIRMLSRNSILVTETYPRVVTHLKTYTIQFLLSESYSLLSRLSQMKRFEMTVPMVKSASVSREALKLVGELLDGGKNELAKRINEFILFLRSDEIDRVRNEDLQCRFTVLKLRFNQILDQLDIYSDVLSQRSESEVGIWLSGLDALAEDGLTVGSAYYSSPAMMVYLDRGHGAAIRRARTRLPGGDQNPLAVIQIPRERMVGNGIASSLIHEVGHQAAALLDLVTSLKLEIARIRKSGTRNIKAWACFERWASEIIADFWAVAQLGVSATIGLMNVVTLPGYFQFRIDLDDPHPAPYVRVQLSCRMGKKLFPDPQWDRLWTLWQSFYPTHNLPEDKQSVLQQMENEMDAFIALIISHKPIILRGITLIDIFDINHRQPKTFRQVFRIWKANPKLIESASPVKVFAVLGQAKADLVITPSEETSILKHQLTRWANIRNI